MIESKANVPKILHIITGLEQGGAESLLYNILLKGNEIKKKQMVVSLTGPGYYKKLLEDIGVEVLCLNLSKFNFIKSFFSLAKIIYRFDTVHCWMYHSNIIGGFFAKLMRTKNIIWSIHHLSVCKKNLKGKTRLIIYFGALFSKFIPTHCIYVSNSSRLNHEKLGYNKKISNVIYNGVDVDVFRPIDNISTDVLGGQPKGDSFFLGFIARWDANKDHEMLFKSLSVLKKHDFVFKCFLVGLDMDKRNAELTSLIDYYSLNDVVELLGVRNDIPVIMNILDLHVLSSVSEAFGNVIAESMACGTPCVSTEVGCTKDIIGDTGWLVSVCDHEDMAQKIMAASRFIDKERSDIARNCRDRIICHYNLESVFKKYCNVWDA